MEKEDFEQSLLKTLHHFQHEGHLCDVTLVSSDHEEFVTLSGVLAAVSAILRQELQKCDRGGYKGVTSLSGQEIEAFIHYADTGDPSNTNLTSD